MENKILVTRSSMPSMEEYIEEIKPLWESKWLTNMGEKHKELEIKLKEYMSVDEISLFSNGHMALELLLQAMDLKGEVITTPFTFASTTHAIVRNGLKPVFCDINPTNYTIDVNKIEDLITDKTCAILAVHVYGNICDVKEIDRIAKKYNLKVIYDAAHTFGVRYEGKGIGTYGDASMFSFHSTKVFNTIEGGAVTYSDKEIGEKLYQLKNFGIKTDARVSGVGANAKMNEFQASMGLCNLRHIDEEIKKREQVVKRYELMLKDVEGITVSEYDEHITPNYSYFPVLFNEKKFGKSRDYVYEELIENNIFSRKYFYPLTSEFECFDGWFDPSETPIALRVSREVLALPLYADLSLEDVDRICRIILGKEKRNS